MNGLRPVRKPTPNKRPKVTALLGFACKDTIVLASDSQASFASETRKIPDVRKISSVTFKNGAHALVARAGTLDSADYFQEAFETLAATSCPLGERDIATLAETAMKSTRAKIVSQFKEPALSEESVMAHLYSYRCDLILAYYHGTEPFIYTLDLVSALAIKSSHYFTALGCAANIVSFVLTGFDFKKLDQISATGIAAYAIEMCKRHDSACGGSLQFGAIMASGKLPLTTWNDDEMKYAVRIFEKAATESSLLIHEFLSKTVLEKMK